MHVQMAESIPCEFPITGRWGSQHRHVVFLPRYAYHSQQNHPPLSCSKMCSGTMVPILQGLTCAQVYLEDVEDHVALLQKLSLHTLYRTQCCQIRFAKRKHIIALNSKLWKLSWPLGEATYALDKKMSMGGTKNIIMLTSGHKRLSRCEP